MFDLEIYLLIYTILGEAAKTFDMLFMACEWPAHTNIQVAQILSSVFFFLLKKKTGELKYGVDIILKPFPI